MGENEVLERRENVTIVKRLGFSKCRLSLAIPKQVDYPGISWFTGKKIATSYPQILASWLKEKGITSEIHVINGSVEISPGIGLSDAIFDIVSSGSTLVSNRLKEVEVVVASEAVLVAHPAISETQRAVLEEFIFRLESVQRAEGKNTSSSTLPMRRSPILRPSSRA